MNEPVETSEIVAFSRTVEAKSLSRAALELRVPRATLSRRLARLEERLGVRLLRRTTRSLALTDAGDAFYRHARIVLDALAHAEHSVRQTDDVPRGDLRVSVPPIMNASFFEMIGRFAKAYPHVRLHLHFSAQHVDLVRDGYDVAIRASSSLEPGLIARTLASTPAIAVASPSYLAAHGAPRTARDLAQHRLLLGFTRGAHPQTHWPLANGRNIAVDGVFSSNEVTMLADAAARGLGIALLPRMIVDAHIADGALVQVLPDVVVGKGRVAIVYLERELVPPQLRIFVDHVVAWAKHGLERPEPARVRSPLKKSRRGTK